MYDNDCTKNATQSVVSSRQMNESDQMANETMFLLRRPTMIAYTSRQVVALADTKKSHESTRSSYQENSSVTIGV